MNKRIQKRQQNKDAKPLTPVVVQNIWMDTDVQEQIKRIEKEHLEYINAYFDMPDIPCNYSGFPKDPKNNPFGIS